MSDDEEAEKRLEEQRSKWDIQRKLQEQYRRAIRKDARLSLSIPETLLHYTSLGAFYSMASNHALRASRAELSNDTGEMTLAAAVVDEVLEERDARTALQPSMIEGIKGLLAERDISTMVTCFTEPKQYKATEKLLPADILSMWRAYGSAGEGVAIHFSGKQLVQLAASAEGLAAGTRLLRVIYDPDEQFDLVKTVVNLARDELLGKLPEYSPEWISWATRAIATELSSFSAMFKHPGFAEEKEWRLVCNIVPFEADQIAFVEQRGIQRGCVHFIARRSADEESSDRAFFAQEQDMDTDPFINPEQWVKERTRLPIVGVTVGPSSRQRAMAISVTEWAKRYGYAPTWGKQPEFPVLSSQIPFRG